MSFLKKVIDIEEMECGKSFTNIVLWSDAMDTINFDPDLFFNY